MSLDKPNLGVATLEPTIAEFQDISTTIISDCLDRLPGCVGLTRFYTGPRMVGIAFTVQTRAGDNLAIHQALEIARPGNIIVVDGAGDTSRALVGEIMKVIAETRGLGGFVIDGAIRDVEAFRASSFPCFARAVIHRGPYKAGPGALGVPVTLGGTVICPGDIVVGDADGVVSFSPAIAETLLRSCRDRMEQEEHMLQAIRNGTYDGRYAKS